MIESDEVLMKQFQGGDEKAFIALMERYQHKIFNFFLRQCHDYALTEELTQDIFMRLFKYGKSYDCTREFRPWFYRIALNMIRREFTTKERTTGLQENIVYENQFFNPDYDLIDGVKKAITALPQPQREVLMLKTYQELTFAEIAQVMGCPEATVKSRLYQAYTKLRKTLKKFRR